MTAAANEENWARALERANQIRRARAQMLAEIRSGERDVLEVIEHDQSGIKLTTVLQAVPRIGGAACQRMLNEVDLSHSLCLGGAVTSSYRPATARERAAIIGVVRGFLERQARAAGVIDCA